MLLPIVSRIIHSVLDWGFSQSFPLSQHCSLAAGEVRVEANTIRVVVATIITRISRMKVFLNISVALKDWTKVF